jgi:UDP-GlcNAc:undecaprenyl-phosphate/decaprenyl-phosphate GlcNAc-1-phosphate transferase
MNLLSIIFGLIGMGIVVLVTPVALRRLWVCRPLVRGSEAHHTHSRPIPRLGGAILALAFVVLEILVEVAAPEQRAATPGRWVVIVSSLAMFALGFCDDLRPLGARKKLLVQVLIATFVCCSGITIQVFKVPFGGWVVNLDHWSPLLSPVVTVFWLVAMTNLINLIDGVDGLAGGICLMLMLLIAFMVREGGCFGLLACGMAGALLGFLFFNFPPARIFLGDGGAYFLGFQIGLFALVNSHKGTVVGALIAPLFVLALPLADTSLAILRRGLRGLPIFRPDRRHLHHHLLAMGLSRRTVVLSFYAVTLVFLGMGLLTVWSRGQMVPLLFGLSVVLLLAIAGQLKFSRDWFAVGRVVGNSLAIRTQVQYTTSLTRWLELEGARAASLECLWQDLVFVSEKLGLASIRLTLADGAYSWQHPQRPQSGPCYKQVVKAGRLGVLELEGLCALPQAGASALAPQAPVGPVTWDQRTFEIISELVAEGWTKAVGSWCAEEKARLRLDAKLVPPHPGRSGWLARVASSLVAQTGRFLNL